MCRHRRGAHDVVRLPGKVLLPAAGRPLLQILIERLRRAPGLDGVVIATTVNASDDPVAALGERLGVGIFRGSEGDVLGRVCGALRASRADVCVEITGDCPLIDPAIVGEALTEFLSTRDVHPYVSNSAPHRSVPAGLDVQVFFAEALFQLEATTGDPEDREHVSYGSTVRRAAITGTRASSGTRLAQARRRSSSRSTIPRTTT